MFRFPVQLRLFKHLINYLQGIRTNLLEGPIDDTSSQVEVVRDGVEVAPRAIERRREPRLGLNGCGETGQGVGSGRARRDPLVRKPSVGGERLSAWVSVAINSKRLDLNLE